MAFDFNAIFANLFGTGNVEVSGGGTEQVGSANLLSPEQQQLLSTLVGGIQNTPVGVPVAGESPLQQLGFEGLQNAAQSPVLAGSFNQSGDVLNDLLAKFDPASTTDFFNKSIRDPSLRTFEQDIIPLIQESFADQGENSGLNRSFERAGGNLASDLSAQLSTLLFNTEQATQNRRLSTLPLAQNFRQEPLDFFNNLLSAGGEQRGIEQEQLNAQFIHPFERFLPLALQTQGTAPIVQSTPFTTQNTGIF